MSDMISIKISKWTCAAFSQNTAKFTAFLLNNCRIIRRELFILALGNFCYYYQLYAVSPVHLATELHNYCIRLAAYELHRVSKLIKVPVCAQTVNNKYKQIATVNEVEPVVISDWILEILVDYLKLLSAIGIRYFCRIVANLL